MRWGFHFPFPFILIWLNLSFQDDRRVFWRESGQCRSSFYQFDNFQDLWQVKHLTFDLPRFLASSHPPHLPPGLFFFQWLFLSSFSSPSHSPGPTWSATTQSPSSRCGFGYWGEITMNQLCSDGKHPSWWEPGICPGSCTVRPWIQVTLNLNDSNPYSLQNHNNLALDLILFDHRHHSNLQILKISFSACPPCLWQRSLDGLYSSPPSPSWPWPTSARAW